MNPDLVRLARTYWGATMSRNFAQAVALLYPGDVDKFRSSLLWCASAMARFGETAGLLALFGPGMEIEDLRVMSPEKFLTRYLEGMMGRVPPASWQEMATSFRPGRLTQLDADRAILAYCYDMPTPEGAETWEREMHFSRVNGTWYVMLDAGLRRMADAIRGRVSDFEHREAKDRKVDPDEADGLDLEPFAIWGFKNGKGEIVLEPRFAAAGDFHAGLAPVKFFKKWGYIGIDGTTVIAPRFDRAAAFSEDLAAVAIYNDALDLAWGYIDREGRTAIAPRFSSAEAFRNGRAEVTIEQDGQSVVCHIDRTGKVVAER
ncbi:MAG TPA: WG repeat-containing protein [Lacunisphaera sp.]|nr:WG repeat-containing protein [Lacunisphaera sp.]